MRLAHGKGILASPVRRKDHCAALAEYQAQHIARALKKACELFAGAGGALGANTARWIIPCDGKCRRAGAGRQELYRKIKLI